MQKFLNLVFVQALLSTIAGILLSKMSLVGKVGIFFLYKDYALLKVWWKAALVIFALQLLFILVFWMMKSLFGRSSTLILLLFLGIGALGAYITYQEFTSTSYRLMKSTFHLGGYLIWVGYAISCIYFMWSRQKKKVEALPSEEVPLAPRIVEDPHQKPLEG
jgi:hypothetical protein